MRGLREGASRMPDWKDRLMSDVKSGVELYQRQEAEKEKKRDLKRERRAQSPVWQTLRLTGIVVGVCLAALRKDLLVKIHWAGT
jgi:multisubunit Na+/H+ antiporter MnhC subunit